MTREAIIQKTIQALSVLPEDKAVEVLNFAGFILKKYEETSLQQGIHQLQSQSNTFSFLNDEEDLYSQSDFKEKY